MYKYLFGPVPSRRLGMSLGVDLVPRKVCSLDCVYCEVGKTTKLTTDRKEYILFGKIQEELIHYFDHNPDPDYITFSGSGEPTLNIRLGDVLDFIKKIKPDIPVAVLTNGTLLSDKEVRKSLLKSDIVLPSLDAATEEGFIKINRPAQGLKIEAYIQGLVDFRNEYTGKIWLEILILPGYNDSEIELGELKKAILRIKPDKVQLNTLDRPGTLSGIGKSSMEQLEGIIAFWGLDAIEIIAKAPERKSNPAYRSDIETAILETIARRPCTLEDIQKITGIHVNEINKYLDTLEADGKVSPVQLERGIFYQLKAR